jgi:hypothetical protein
MPSVHEGSHSTCRTALHGNTVKFLVNRNGIRGNLLRSIVIPVTNYFDDVILWACGILQNAAQTDVTITVYRVAGKATDFKNLAAIWHILFDPVSVDLADSQLVFVDLQDLVAVQHVVERHKNNACLVGTLDNRSRCSGVYCDGDNGVVAGVNEVIDGRNLCRNVCAGLNNLQFLHVWLHIRLFRIGLDGLDHLNAPGIANKPVRLGNAIGTFLFGKFEKLGIGVERLETFRRKRWLDHSQLPAPLLRRWTPLQPSRRLPQERPLESSAFVFPPHLFVEIKMHQEGLKMDLAKNRLSTRQSLGDIVKPSVSAFNPFPTLSCFASMSASSA